MPIWRHKRKKPRLLFEGGVGSYLPYLLIEDQVEKKLLAQIHLDIREVDLAIIHEITIGDSVPTRAHFGAFPVGCRLHFALTFDAQGAVGQCVEPNDGDFCFAAFAKSVSTLFQPI